jgi:NAD(P)-dependent dehydrogenase (short-subunit alcohol dehydrogenase family)
MDGKTAVVTGAASGIGRATVEQFVEEGATVAALDIREEEVQAAAQEIDGEVDPYQIDVKDRGRFEEILSDVRDAHGSVDVLFNNAGILRLAPFEEASEDDYQLQVDVNMKGVWNGCQAAVPVMKEQGSGAIVNTASVDAIMGAPYHAAYGMTKAGVMNLTKTLASELGGHGIRVNAICPGSTRSPPLEQYIQSQDDPDAAREEMESAHALGKLGEPREIANCVLFLASDKASNVTGHGMVVDGGYSIQKETPFGP